MSEAAKLASAARSAVVSTERLAHKALDSGTSVLSVGIHYNITSDSDSRQVFLKRLHELSEALGDLWGKLTGRSSHGVYLPEDFRPYHFLATVASTSEVNGITASCLSHIALKYALEVWRCVKHALPVTTLPKGFFLELTDAAFPIAQAKLRAFAPWDHKLVSRIKAEITQEVRRAAVRVPGVVADTYRVTPNAESPLPQQTDVTVNAAQSEPNQPGTAATSAKRSPYTLGQLVAVLDGIEQGRETRRLNNQEQLRRNPLNAMMNRVYESALAWRPDETQMPGISRIELLCDRLPGEAGITAAKVRHLRADICERQRCQISQANALTLNEAADTLEGVQRVSLAEQQSAQQSQLHHGLTMLDTIQVGVEPGDFVQVTGVSCKVIAGTTPTACPDANPVLPPSLLGVAEQAIRRLHPLPAGTTIHWLGHDTGVRSRCRCAAYRDAPFTAPFDQHRWADVKRPDANPYLSSQPSDPFTVADIRDLLSYQAKLAAHRARLKSVNPNELVSAQLFPWAQPIRSLELLASLIEPTAPRLTQDLAWTLATYRCLVETAQAEHRTSPTENDLMLLVGRIAARTTNVIDELMRLPEREFYKFVETGDCRGPEAPPLTEQEPLTLGLDASAVAVLSALGDVQPRLLKNVEIEAATDLSKQTVTNAVTDLIGKKLATRPNGERKGATTTTEGNALLKRLRNSSEDHP